MPLAGTLSPEDDVTHRELAPSKPPGGHAAPTRAIDPHGGICCPQQRRLGPPRIFEIARETGALSRPLALFRFTQWGHVDPQPRTDNQNQKPSDLKRRARTTAQWLPSSNRTAAMFSEDATPVSSCARLCALCLCCCCCCIVMTCTHTCTTTTGNIMCLCGVVVVALS
jgi:hypothetical protein